MKRKAPAQQIAALPFRKRRGKVEVLLITSRETKRWVIPKGWPMAGLKDFTSAKREALEEAGVSGQISKTALGQFDYEKRLKDGKTLTCSVLVFPLHVKKQQRNWKEKSERTRSWFLAEEAAKRVQEPILKTIIQTFI